jgi:transposase InsO family protein
VVRRAASDVYKRQTQLSISTIKKIIGDPCFKNKNKGYRYGEEWMTNNFEPFKLRLEPENNGTLWQMDGSRLQIPYLGENNTPKFLVLFVVMDVHSRRIIGFSFGKSENHKMVLEAISKAVEMTRYVPRELLRDNGKCFEHKNYKFLEEYLNFLGCYVRKHKVGLARDKAHVERFFSTLQTTVLNEIEGYIGEGVKSRREEGRPAKKVIQKYLNKGTLRTRTALEKLIPTLIEKYNNQVLSEKHAPNVRFKIAEKDPFSTDVSKHEFALMFWKHTTVQVKNSMILLTEGKHRNKRFQYIIHDKELRYRLNLTEVQVYYQKNDRHLIKLFDHNLNWITDLTREVMIPSVKSRKVERRKDRPMRISDSTDITHPKKKIKIERNKQNRLFRQPATLDLILTKTKNND